MRLFKALLVVVCLAASGHALADNFQDTIANFRKADAAQKYFSSAYGYAVFPTIGKGGIGIGGAGGKGNVYERGALIGESTMVQISVGFQLGGQAYSQIVFFKDKRALDEFTSTGFEFGADASAVAITLGASAKAGTTGASATASTTVNNAKAATAEYYKGMAVLTLAKGGLMYEAVLAGQKYSFKKQ